MSTVRTISARDANQKFAELLCAVEAGADFVVTRRGKPVARIVAAVVTRRGKPVARIVAAGEDGTRTLTRAQEAAALLGLRA